MRLLGSPSTAPSGPPVPSPPADEPTSGLDSYTADEVMTVLKVGGQGEHWPASPRRLTASRLLSCTPGSLARAHLLRHNLSPNLQPPPLWPRPTPAPPQGLASHGITVCATIHSPTPYTFGLFDRMMLLLRGRVVYFGPNGEAGGGRGAWTWWPCCGLCQPVELGFVSEAWHVSIRACIPSTPAGAAALQYFQALCPCLDGLDQDGKKQGAEWIVDLTTTVRPGGLCIVCPWRRGCDAQRGCMTAAPTAGSGGSRQCLVCWCW